MADGTGGARLARNQEGLAATAAEVLLAALATFARLPHPARAAKRRKRRRHAPDIAKRVLSYIPEFEVRGFSATNSSADFRMPSLLPPAQRYSIAMFWPTIQPECWRL